ncbi:MAG: hypothetical protein V1743_01315 [Nanoarchaeota archaeon]
MKRTHLILLIILLFFLASFLTTLLYFKLHFSTLIEKKIVLMNLEITDQNLLGFDVNTTYLNFGHVPLGGYAEKRITISNNNAFPIKSMVVVNGNISRFVGLSYPTYIFQPGETMNLSVTIDPGEGPVGKYDGILEVFFFRKS